MQLHVLGSGSCMVRQADRTPCGYAVDTPDGVVLVDTGTGTSRMLPRAGLDPGAIAAILHTHRHPDHVSDAVPLIQDKYVASAYYGEQEDRDLQLYGPPGHAAYIDDRLQAETGHTTAALSADYPFQVAVTDVAAGDTVDTDWGTITAAAADHAGPDFPVLGYRLAVGDTALAFTGDTDYTETLVALARDADILVADCSMPDGKKQDGHMTPSECGRMAAAADVDTLLLSHFYPDIDAPGVDPVAQAGDTFSGDIVAAEDLLTLSP